MTKDIILEALDHVLEQVEKSDHWWADDPNRGGVDIDLLQRARYYRKQLIKNETET